MTKGREDDQIIYGFSGKYIWRRRTVWAWQASQMRAYGWYRDRASGWWLRPVMVKRHERSLPVGFGWVA